MQDHYSQPKGFVGRSICYLIYWEDQWHGAIVGGSTPRFLPGREDFFGNSDFLSIINNIFYHAIRDEEGKYPCRNFTSRVLKEFRSRCYQDWIVKYGDVPQGFESLVELPRSGTLYRKDGWTETGITKGFTCKRVAGKGTDSWSGKRVWDTKNLRPKKVFSYKIISE